MIYQRILTTICVFMVLAGGPACSSDAPKTEKPLVSGEIISGFRVLGIDPGHDHHAYTVYRGDYVKFFLKDDVKIPVLKIPSMSVVLPLTREFEKIPIIKMKQAGKYPFSIGPVEGTVTVIEYVQGNYTELSAEQGQALIRKQKPLILDVRTPKEYRMGHLEGAMLIPVQHLQQRLGELADHKESPILIYCATGNRSTVASKILIDKGFSTIYNLRWGIKDWHRRKYPITRN